MNTELVGGAPVTGAAQDRKARERYLLLVLLLVLRRVRARLGHHGIALAAVLGACVIGQIEVYAQRPVAAWLPDSATYVAAANEILRAHQFVDAWRTPGYPTLLALVFGITGGQNLLPVVVVQSVLIVLASLQIYVLAYRICNRRWVAAVIAGMAGIDPFVVNWERTILSEALTYWLVVTLFLLFEVYLRHSRTAYLGTIGLLSVAVIVTRPQYMYLPFILAAIVTFRSLRQHRVRQIVPQVTLSCVVPVLLVFGYCASNVVVTGYFGLSDVSNLNLFGKVLEYNMFDLSGPAMDTRTTEFRGEVDRAAASWQLKNDAHDGWANYALTNDLWDFVHAHTAYDARHWAIYGEYSTAVIAHHPLLYVERSLPDLIRSAYASPILLAEWSYVPPWLIAIWTFFIFVARIYVFLPILVVVLAVGAWRRITARRLILLTLVLTIAGNIAFSALTDFTEFWRIRFPTDWCMTLVFVVILVQATRWSARVLAAKRGRWLRGGTA